MKPVYDYVFVTHLPAFYKVNLYREIAKHCAVLVVFLARGSSIRTGDFVCDLPQVDHIILSDGTFEKRDIWKNIMQLKTLFHRLRYRRLVLGGWDLLEYWYLAWRSDPAKNALALESTVYDSRHEGWRRWAKCIYLSRIGSVFASGNPHQALLTALGFRGKTWMTQGVGIFNYAPRAKENRVFSGRFLYVGRIAPEKNLERLIAVFRQLPPFTLTIVGQGPLEASLKKQSPPNVQWWGYLPNATLGSCYATHDVFILPSLQEPWGVVVEEALYHGLPVVVSDRVGCARDWVVHYQVGALCDPLDNHAIEEAIWWVVSRYAVLCKQIERIDFLARDHLQVQRYLEALA